MIRAYDDNGNIVDLVDWEKQIRADVIDEFLKKDKECQQKHEECPYMYSEISCVECIAEQLKEQKNTCKSSNDKCAGYKDGKCISIENCQYKE